MFLKKSVKDSNDVSASVNNVTLMMCDSVFVKRFDWTDNDPLMISGKINCPGCTAEVGEYKLSGSKCSCGHKEQPAYRLKKDKVFFC